MSARDDLADLLDPRRKSRRSGGSVLLSAESVTEIILSAGWRPPARMIETVEELDALAYGTVILDQAGDPLEALPDTSCMLFWLGDEPFQPSSVTLPATVIWEPGDDDE